MILLTILLIIYLVQNSKYKKTEYFHQTHIPFLKMRFNKGRYGEFLTYKYLRSLNGNKKFLFNCYIPSKGSETTEIDVLMLHDSGIYVFESKNYSGWIFGTETNRNWTQTLPAGRGRSQKRQFFNPILQNKGHCKWLSSYLGERADIPMYSYILFSDRCTLKNIKLTSNEHCVINRYNVLGAVRKNADIAGIKCDNETIESLYTLLYPLTQTTDEQKLLHVQQINDKYNNPVNNKPVENETIAEAIPTSYEASADTKICPRCGAPLVQRTAKKGEKAGTKFWGCSGFPKCRYIENIDESNTKKLSFK
ncbi:MAG: NERD domain-containing protein [Oscillospiraceae bacterium]|nr:NERD domain-containing protein [Oscillospiraceae bacterium]